MTKMNLFGTSFVAAIPGLALGYLMLMVVLNHFDRIPMVLKIVTILAFVMALMMVLFPAGIMIWYGGRGKSAVKGKETAAGAAVGADQAEMDEELVVDEEPADDSFGEVDEDFESASDLEESDELSSGDDLDEFEADGGLDDEFEFDEFEDDEEEF